MSTSSPTPSPSSLISVLSVVLNSELTRSLLGAVLQWWNTAHYRGTYRVESHHVLLELMDKGGQTAVYTKRQGVIFLQDNVFAIQDQAWGDGDIFMDYRCSPGVVTDRYKEGYRWKILISLQHTYNRGEREAFVIERKINGGFTTAVGNFHTQIDHPTQDLSISVIFPQSRQPKQVSIIEQNWKRQHILGKEDQIPLSQGRTQYQFTVHKPRLYEGYILRWEW